MAAALLPGPAADPAPTPKGRAQLAQIKAMLAAAAENEREARRLAEVESKRLEDEAQKARLQQQVKTAVADRRVTQAWEQICARCTHFTTIGYPEHKARGEGRCTEYDGTSYELRNPFVAWDHRTCVHFIWANPMAPRSAWIEKQQARQKNDEAQTKTKG